MLGADSVRIMPRSLHGKSKEIPAVTVDRIHNFGNSVFLFSQGGILIEKRPLELVGGNYVHNYNARPLVFVPLTEDSFHYLLCGSDDFCRATGGSVEGKCGLGIILVEIIAEPVGLHENSYR